MSTTAMVVAMLHNMATGLNLLRGKSYSSNGILCDVDDWLHPYDLLHQTAGASNSLSAVDFVRHTGF